MTIAKEVRHDTVYLYRGERDSTYERKTIRTIRDTVFVTHTLRQTHFRVDTVLHTRTDSIPYEVVVTQHVPYVPRFYRWCTWIVIALAVTIFGWIALRLYLKK